MTDKQTNFNATHGSIASGVINGDVVVNNDFSKEIGFSEQEIKLKENQYLNWVVAEYSRLEWLSLMELHESQQGVQLESVYTSLLTKGHRIKKDVVGSRLKDEPDPLRRGRFSVIELLNQEKFLVLLGDPGSGKSALINFVSICLAGHRLDKKFNINTLTEPLPDKNGDPQYREVKIKNSHGLQTNKRIELVRQKWNHGSLLPFKIILRDFSASDIFPGSKDKPSSQHLLKFIKKDLKAKGLRGYFDILKKRLQDGEALVMFDGLDEVAQADNRRKRLVGCIDAFSKSYSGCRFLVTCRPYAYRDPKWRLPQFYVDELEGFEHGQIIQFIDRWYRSLPSNNTKNNILRGELLKKAVLERAVLWDLAKRPLLLSLIAYLHAYRHSLPDRRANLYERLIELLVDKWEKARFEIGDDGVNVARKLSQASLVEYLKMGQDSILNVLKRLAFDAHASQDKKNDTADISAADLHNELLSEAVRSNNRGAALLNLSEYLRDRVGILYQRGGSNEVDAIYTFPHRSFQEFLAADYFRREESSMFERFYSSNFQLEEFTWQELAAKLGRVDPDRWREVVVLAGGIHSESDLGSVWNLLKELSIYQNVNLLSKEEVWGLRLAGEILVESVNLLDMGPRQAQILKKIRLALINALGTNHLPTKERVKISQYLSQIGDPRLEVHNVDSMIFCYVPRGQFWMGYEEYSEVYEAFGLQETPSGLYDINYSYWISQAPVSVAQFKVFINESGYEIGDRDSLEGEGNEPVLWVSQREALIFCEWLTRRWHQMELLPAEWVVKLPNEPEWEKAARGGVMIPTQPKINSVDTLNFSEKIALKKNSQPQRRYPFGNQINTELANYDGHTGLVLTTGIFPKGMSVYGCYDLSGNIWEWTRSEKGKYPYPAVGTDEWKSRESKFLNGCVLRGGAFYNLPDDVRCSIRFNRRPIRCNNFIGFRVALIPSALI